jgi:hypothetical protein
MERITASKIFNELERSDRTDDQEMEEKALENFKLVYFLDYILSYDLIYLEQNIGIRVNSQVQMNKKIS